MIALLGVAVDAASAQEVPPAAQPGTVPGRLEPAPVPRAEPPVSVPPAEPGEVPPGADEVRFVLTGLALDGLRAYREAELLPLYDEYLGERISLATLFAIADRITAKYRNDGYILSRAVVPPQEIRGGVARIQVVEGFVDDIIIDESQLRGPAEQVLAKARRIQASRPLRAAVLERYLLLMNDLPGLEVEAVLRPSAETPGAADLVLTVRHDAVSGEVEVDNRGTRFLGPVQLSVLAALNSVLGLYERTVLRGVVAAEVEELQLVSVEHTQPLGVEGTTATLYGAYVRTEPGEELSELDIEGESVSATLSVAHPLRLTRSERLTVYGEASFLNSETDAFGGDETLVEDDVRALRLGATYDTADRFGGVNLIALEISRGFDVLGASDDGEDPDFTKLAARASRLQALAPGWSLFLAAAGQFTDDPLAASELFDYGGEEFGRAFEPFEISGDRGVAVRAELRYTRAPDLPYLVSYQPFVSVDYGAVEDAEGDDDSNRGASASVGVRVAFTPWLSGSAELGVPLMLDDGDEDPGGFFRLQARF